MTESPLVYVGVLCYFSAEPSIARFPSGDKHAMEGERVVFRVRVTGSPQPKLTWYHDGVEVKADYSKELAEDGSFTMPSAETKLSGVYQLVAVNPAGRVEREVKLFVKKEGEPSPFVARKQTSFSPVLVAAFGQYVASCHANDNRIFRDQYSVSCVTCVRCVRCVSDDCCPYRNWIKMETTLRPLVPVQR